MDGDIDGAGEERLFDFPGEQSLAADLAQRPVADAVAGGNNHLHGDAVRIETMGRYQPVPHFGRRDQGQLRAAASDAQQWGLHGILR